MLAAVVLAVLAACSDTADRPLATGAFFRIDLARRSSGIEVDGVWRFDAPSDFVVTERAGGGTVAIVKSGERIFEAHYLFGGRSRDEGLDSEGKPTSVPVVAGSYFDSLVVRASPEITSIEIVAAYSQSQQPRTIDSTRLGAARPLVGDLAKAFPSIRFLRRDELSAEDASALLGDYRGSSAIYSDYYEALVTGLRELTPRDGDGHGEHLPGDDDLQRRVRQGAVLLAMDRFRQASRGSSKPTARAVGRSSTPRTIA